MQLLLTRGLARACILGAAAFCIGGAALGTASGSGTLDKLVRVAGTVEYQRPSTSMLEQVFGEVDLPSDALAITLADSRALLRMADSSEIDIGAKARFRVATIDAIATSNPTRIALQLGAMHFIVRHPAGSHANYVFSTPTSQIAVRGTEGYVVVGPRGLDFYCATCESGDVVVETAGESIAVVTGQQVFIDTSDVAHPKTTVVKAPCTNPAAIAISNGKLGRAVPPSQWIDTTGSLDADPLSP